MPLRINGVEMSPCIVAKAKHALGIATSYKGNNKKWSQGYWNIVVDKLGAEHRLSASKIQAAKKRVGII